jgi:hypothetical protein
MGPGYRFAHPGYADPIRGCVTPSDPETIDFRKNNRENA